MTNAKQSKKEILSAVSNVNTDFYTLSGGSPMVVFSHGFGVKRDSRGMFTDIVDSLPPEWGYILFDYNEIDGTNVRLAPYSLQTKKLKSMLELAAQHSDNIYLIAHSMGCITAALLKSITVNKALFLAPPVHGPRPNAKNSWAERPDAYYEGTTLVVPRRDGTTSIVAQEFFDELKLVDCPKVINDYSRMVDMTVIQALDEDIIQHPEQYDSLDRAKLHLIKLPGNHNFDPPHRAELVATIGSIVHQNSTKPKVMV